MAQELLTTELRTLLDRARAGDRGALDELLRRAAGRLEELSAAMNESSDRAEELRETLQAGLERDTALAPEFNSPRYPIVVGSSTAARALTVVWPGSQPPRFTVASSRTLTAMS